MQGRKYFTSNMADNTVNSAADNSICISVVDCLNNLNTSQLRDKPIAFVNGKLKWYGNFESLKIFVETTLNLKGKWSSPGSHLRLFSDAFRQCCCQVLYKLGFSAIDARR